MKIIFSILFIALIIYSHIYNFQQKILYISVDAFNLLPGSDESVVVSFGKNDDDFHAFAIKKKDIKQGVELVSKSKNNLNFSVFADLEGEALVRSHQAETFAKIKVLSIDKQNQKAVFSVEANLLNINTNELNKLDKTKVIVKDKPFLKLM
ncbi:hypothetical protein [Pseudoalteromonas sp. SG43-4]|uniref:hypothetical protein n=1 Tax=Pseudoalteromonas sp. SG43-4 TaxID=2760969 RepID=UPI002175912C|nr:hypothetical protein [Pseudoalteromonas sp. SG43-4]